RGARRWHWEIVAPHLVEGVEMGEIGQEDLRPDHLVERAARGLKGLREIAQHITGLLLDVGAVSRKTRPLACFGSHPGLVIAGDLAGCEHPWADFEALVIVRQRARCARSYGFDVHGVLPVCLVPHGMTAATRRATWSKAAFRARIAASIGRASAMSAAASTVVTLPCSTMIRPLMRTGATACPSSTWTRCWTGSLSGTHGGAVRS